MGTRSVVETRRDRKALVADAGYKQLSFTSAIAGVLAAYGAFALLAGLAVGVLRAADADIDVSSQWQELGLGGGLVVAGLLLLAYLFGGYVAGRMARRAGTLHGIVVFVLGVAVAAIGAVIAREVGGADVANDNLRNLGVPTTADEWGDVATVAGIASLAAMLLGSVTGGALGERWHGKLLTRAVDPDIGAEADARRDAEVRSAEAEERRVSAFRRVRATTPTRTRRVDRDADDTLVTPTGPALRPSAGDGTGTGTGDGNGNGNRDADRTVARNNRNLDGDGVAGDRDDRRLTDRRIVRSDGRTE